MYLSVLILLPRGNEIRVTIGMTKMCAVGPRSESCLLLSFFTTPSLGNDSPLIMLKVCSQWRVGGVRMRIILSLKKEIGRYSWEFYSILYSWSREGKHSPGWSPDDQRITASISGFSGPLIEEYRIQNIELTLYLSLAKHS